MITAGYLITADYSGCALYDTVPFMTQTRFLWQFPYLKGGGTWNLSTNTGFLQGICHFTSINNYILHISCVYINSIWVQKASWKNSARFYQIACKRVVYATGHPNGQNAQKRKKQSKHSVFSFVFTSFCSICCIYELLFYSSWRRGCSALGKIPPVLYPSNVKNRI